MLEVGCHRCERRGGVSLARLIDEHGADTGLPDLWETLAGRTFAEYMHHNQPGTRFWGRLYDEFPDYQLALVDGDALVAELHSVPMPWEGRTRLVAV